MSIIILPWLFSRCSSLLVPAAAQPMFVFGPAIVYSVPHVLSSDHEVLASDWSVTQIPASDWPPTISRCFAHPTTLPILTPTV